MANSTQSQSSAPSFSPQCAGVPTSGRLSPSKRLTTAVMRSKITGRYTHCPASVVELQWRKQWQSKNKNLSFQVWANGIINSGKQISSTLDRWRLPLATIWGMRVGNQSLLASISVSWTDLKGIQTPHSLFRDFGSDKTLTTRWSGGRVQVWVQVWTPAGQLAIFQDSALAQHGWVGQASTNTVSSLVRGSSWGSNRLAWI